MTDRAIILEVFEEGHVIGLHVPERRDLSMQRYAAILLFVIEQLAEDLDAPEAAIIACICTLALKPGRPKPTNEKPPA